MIPIIRAHVQFPSSFGIIGHFIMREIYKTGMDHYLYPISNKPGPFPLIEYEYLMDKKIDSNMLKRLVPNTSMLSITTIPLLRPKSKHQVLYTDWEGSKTPEFYNKSTAVADIILVPSKFAYDAFRAGGSHSRVGIVPHGIDPVFFPIQNPKGKFTFLCIAVNDWRKGLDILIDAFTSEFRVTEANLRIRSSIDIGRYSNITIDRSKIPFSQMGSMYNAHAFVLPTRGEGFCLPALEALASGLPVIITGVGGQVDFLGNDYFPIDVSGKAYINNPDIPDYDEIEYVEPSIDSLRKQMRYVYENWEHARRKALRGTHRVRDQYTWTNTLSMLVDYLGDE